MILKSLHWLCMERIGRDPRCVAASDRLLGSVHRSQLIAWLAAHDFLIDPLYYRHIVRKVLNQHIRGLDLDTNTLDTDCLEWLGVQCDRLEALKLCCSFKSVDLGVSKMLSEMKNLRWLEIRELKLERNDVFVNLHSPRLERVVFQLYVRDYEWNELEHLVDKNPTIKQLTFNARGRTLRKEDALLLKISDRLQATLVDLELDNFSSEKGPLSVLLLSCRQLKRVKLTGSLQFDLDTMVRCQQICKWELFDVTFQVTPPRETYDALQYLPDSIVELGFKFGPSNRHLICLAFSKIPRLSKLRYHTEFFNDQLTLNLLTSVQRVDQLDTVDIGLCENLTDDGLEIIADSCRSLRNIYLHSDMNKYNRQATGMPLCRIIENAECAQRIRCLYFNYFKVLSGDFLQMVAARCENLEEIHLASVRAVNDAVLKLFALNCRNLTSLDIGGCWSVTDRGVVALAENLNLINLNVAMCFKLTNKVIVALSKNCPNLERFVYHGVPGMKKSPNLADLKLFCYKRLKNYMFQWYS